MRKLALIATAALLLVACTGDDDDTVSAGSGTTSTTAPAPTTTAGTDGTDGTTTTTLIEGGEALEPIDPTELASDPGWTARPDDPAAIDEFNDYVADGPKPYADSALDLAAVFLGLEEPEEGGRIEAAVEQAVGGTLVTVLESGLADDSLAAILTRLRFTEGNGALQLIEVGREFSCQPGRGHEEFSTEPCT